MVRTARISPAAVGFALAALIGTVPAATPKFSEWSPPINLGPTINSLSTDAGPAISKNGLSLYFSSSRSGGFGDHDIWVSQRAGIDAPWGTPQNLGPVVNSGGVDNTPALSRDGHWLFFNSNRPGGHGQLDLWASYRAHTHDEFAWEAPFNLGAGVNSSFLDGGAGFSENDDISAPLLFFGSTRPGGFGSVDIYVSALMANGTFGTAFLVPELSSTGSDQRPSVRFDGLEVFLHSDRFDSVGGADLWASTRDSLSQAWSIPVNLGSTVNSTGSEQQPSIASDGNTLFFASDRPGGFGGLDLYVTTRTKVHRSPALNAEPMPHTATDQSDFWQRRHGDHEPIQRRLEFRFHDDDSTDENRKTAPPSHLRSPAVVRDRESWSFPCSVSQTGRSGPLPSGGHFCQASRVGTNRAPLLKPALACAR